MYLWSPDIFVHEGNFYVYADVVQFQMTLYTYSLFSLVCRTSNQKKKKKKVSFKEHIEIRTSLAKAELNMLLDESSDQYSAVAAGKQCSRCPKTFGFFSMMIKTQCNMCASIICKNCSVELDVSGFLGKEAGRMTLCTGPKGCKGYLGGQVSM